MNTEEKRPQRFPFALRRVNPSEREHPPPTWGRFLCALFAGLGFGIRRMSRACALSVLPLYIIKIALDYVGTCGKSLLGSPIARILSTLMFGLIASRFSCKEFEAHSLIRA